MEGSEVFLAAVLEVLRTVFPAKRDSMHFHVKLTQTMRKRINTRFNKLFTAARTWALKKRLCDPAFKIVTEHTGQDVITIRKAFGLKIEHTLSAEHLRSWLVRVYHHLDSPEELGEYPHFRFPDNCEIPADIYCQLPQNGMSVSGWMICTIDTSFCFP